MAKVRIYLIDDIKIGEADEEILLDIRERQLDTITEARKIADTLTDVMLSNVSRQHCEHMECVGHKSDWNRIGEIVVPQKKHWLSSLMDFLKIRLYPSWWYCCGKMITEFSVVYFDICKVCSAVKRTDNSEYEYYRKCLCCRKVSRGKYSASY